jgi:pimeloyl-ACP methyl ester carboxylesterase
MGSMIAARLAALEPQRVLSLSLISGTGGRWQAVPQTLTALWLGIKVGG